LAVCCDNFDPQQEVVDIAAAYKINSETVTKLMHPANSFIALVDVCCIFCGIGTTYLSYVSCDKFAESSKTVLNTLLVVMVVFLETYSPVAVNAMSLFMKDDSARSWIVLLKLDLAMTGLLLRFMQAFTSPVSVLSWISVQRQERAAIGSKWLNMDVRDSFTLYALSSSADDYGDKWAPVAVVRKLFSRYTVQYSFLKLLASILISLTLNDDFGYCGYSARSFTQDECPSDCSAHCIFPRPALYGGTSRNNNCDYSTTSCFCENWLMTDLLVMLFNTLHFVLQCYYLIRFNNFDPQQNQIDCVQSYTFVGENITLFLTHPAICFLSVLESAVLIVSWTAVAFQLGVVCGANSNTKGHIDLQSDNMSSGLTFALVMTLLEVYKANMTVATNAWRERRYVWAAFSLLRVDLFVFYGSTLFLQTFLFPFSLMGYASKKMRRLTAGKDTTGKDDTITLPVVLSKDGDGSDNGNDNSVGYVQVNRSDVRTSLLDAPMMSGDEM